MKRLTTQHLGLLAMSACFGLMGSGCEQGGESTIDIPETYDFENRYGEGSSVSYGGQVQRHVLIAELKATIGAIDDSSPIAPGTIVETLNAIYDYKGFGENAASPGTGDYEIGISLQGGEDLAQATLGDIGSPASLEEKVPGNDIDFAGGVVGYGNGNRSPAQVVQDMFEALDDLAVDVANGDVDSEAPYVSPEGVDYQQLIQKYLDGAVAFSQAAADYLSNASLESKDNAGAAEKDGEVLAYTALEHAWDEGFGYFGAARDYIAYTDEEIAGAGGRGGYENGYHDTDEDDEIDLKSEYNFGHSVTAAKRDLGSGGGDAATDFTTQAFNAFIAGRTLIYNAGGNLSDEELEELKGYRDEALGAWEQALGATCIHYINDTLQDLNAAELSFLDYAKHWSELKGYALALQFNTDTGIIAKAQLEELHGLIGDAPADPEGDTLDFQADLVEAKNLLAEVYDFASGNIGLADGTGGW